MLTDFELRKYLSTLQLSQAGRDYIDLVRASEPTRRVQSRIGNVPGKYPSLKMGRTIQFESHRNELAFITKAEYNAEVIEYWDQPPSIPLRYKTNTDRNLGVIHTPDFFLLKSNSAGWVECKTQKDLEKLTVRNPNRFYFDGTRWRCPPGEQLANNYGFFYQVWSSTEINWIYLRNVIFLEDYLKTETPKVAAEQQELILSFVSSKTGIALSELSEFTDDESIPVDTVYQLIACRILYVDLDNQLLTEPARALVYSSYGYCWRILNFQMFQPSEPRYSGLLTRFVFQPGNASPNVDGGSRRQIMQMRFSLADIAAAS